MKIPTAKQLPSGNWRVQLRVYGKRISITAPTAEEATRQAAIQKTAGQLSDGMRHDMTLTQAIDVYIAGRSNVLSPATIRGYEIIKRNRFSGVMHRRISQVRSWQSVINRESTEVSPKTLKNAWGLVSAAIKNCGYDAPRVTLPQDTAEPRAWLRHDEIIEFCNAIRGTRAELPALLALHSLRRSELCALRWRDVDLKRGIIYVRGAVVPNSKGEMVWKKETKNVSSRRSVPILIPRLAEILSDRSDGRDPDDRIVTSSPNTVSKIIRNECEKNGLRVIGCHSLRHSFASVCHFLNIDKIDCMHMGGWATMDTMTKIYTHIEEDAKAANMRKLAEFYSTVR